METWKIIFLSVILILFVNKITFKVSIRIIGFKNENMLDLSDIRLCIFYYVKKSRKIIVL